MDAQVPNARTLQDEAPRSVQEGEMVAALQAGKDPGAVFPALNAVYHLDGGIA